MLNIGKSLETRIISLLFLYISVLLNLIFHRLFEQDKKDKVAVMYYLHFPNLSGHFHGYYHFQKFAHLWQ